MSLLEDIIKSIEEPKLNKLYKYKRLKEQTIFGYDENKLRIKLPEDTVIAGGYVVNTLLNLPMITKNTYGVLKHKTDVDIFLYGNKDYHARIDQIIKDNQPKKGPGYNLIRTENFIEFEIDTINKKAYGYHPTVKVQIILTYNKDILDILNKFDLYASQVAMNHKGTYITRRGKLAMRHKMNIFDPDMANKAYMYRLRKYEEYKDIKVIMPNGTIDFNTMWEKNPSSYNSMYTKVERSTDNITNGNSFGTMVINMEYIKTEGISKRFRIINEKPLDIGNFKHYDGQLALRLYGKKTYLDWLGDNYADIHTNFHKLPKDIIPPITIHKKEGRWLKVNIDERDFYKHYEPLWTITTHKFQPVEYLYISQGLHHNGCTQGIKKSILRTYSVLRLHLRLGL